MAASTTQKLTLRTMALIHHFCTTFNAGVIVRLKGEDIGITADGILWDDNAPVKLNALTIPKATIARMESDLADAEQPKLVTATLFADLSSREQANIRKLFKTEFATT